MIWRSVGIVVHAIGTGSDAQSSDDKLENFASSAVLIASSSAIVNEDRRR